ncbi:MAG: MarR family winged helix-turn-helix transcriptional regulator [Acidimicrobiales bacterium]
MARRRSLTLDPIAEARRRWDERWDGGSPMAAATSIMRAQQIVQAAVDDALRGLGLTFARYEALVLLTFSRRGSLPMGKMGERLMIHPTSVTNIVDRLEQQGLVERLPHPSDRRTTLVSITAEGRRLAELGSKEVAAGDFGLGGMSERELDQLTHLLRKLRIAVGDFRVRPTHGRS